MKLCNLENDLAAWASQMTYSDGKSTLHKAFMKTLPYMQ